MKIYLNTNNKKKKKKMKKEDMFKANNSGHGWAKETIKEKMILF